MHGQVFSNAVSGYGRSPYAVQFSREGRVSSRATDVCQEVHVSKRRDVRTLADIFRGNIYEPRYRKTNTVRFRPHITQNPAVHPQKIGRILKFWIKKHEGLFYPSSKNNRALVFANSLCWFSLCGGSCTICDNERVYKTYRLHVSCDKIPYPVYTVV